MLEKEKYIQLMLGNCADKYCQIKTGYLGEMTLVFCNFFLHQSTFL